MTEERTTLLQPARILAYLGLPADYDPNPQSDPIEFLLRHLRELPPHLSSLFSSITTPKQRTSVPAIRNRRLRYTETDPPELRLEQAKTAWPTIWQGPPGTYRPGEQEAADEKEWFEKEFLSDMKLHVGKLGTLLSGYEEERAFERARALRRAEADGLDSMPEEEESDDEEGEEVPPDNLEEVTDEDSQALFLRSVKERFIYGLLEVRNIDYDNVDWAERWDAVNDRDAEERWFDEEDSLEVAPSFPDV